jgi:cytochrome o ubiquinol oxidase subunit 2
MVALHQDRSGGLDHPDSDHHRPGLHHLQTTHKLDPYRPLESDVKPVTIDVVALDWKWLFIYPDQGIATVNKIVFPAHTPVNFRITSDAVMNSFFIPGLGGQIYAMAGMRPSCT